MLSWCVLLSVSDTSGIIIFELFYYYVTVNSIFIAKKKFEKPLNGWLTINSFLFLKKRPITTGLLTVVMITQMQRDLRDLQPTDDL